MPTAPTATGASLPVSENDSVWGATVPVNGTSVGPGVRHFRWLGMSISVPGRLAWTTLRPRESGHAQYLVEYLAVRATRLTANCETTGVVCVAAWVASCSRPVWSRLAANSAPSRRSGWAILVGACRFQLASSKYRRFL